MNQRLIDGTLVTRPTGANIDNLCVGDLAPDVFGAMSKVVEIYGVGKNIRGKQYILYYTEFGSHNGRISGSMVEGEPVPTVPCTSRWHRVENYPNWE